VFFNDVQRCQDFVTVVASGCGPMVSSMFGRRLGSPPVSSSREFRILGPMRAFVSSSGSIFKLEHFIIYVSLL
jgi:hypothetical protein